MKDIFYTTHIQNNSYSSTNVYNITLNSNKVTLSEFMNQVINDNDKVGMVYIRVFEKDSDRYSTKSISYNNGKIVYNKDVYNALSNDIIFNNAQNYINEAYGSYDYFLTIRK